MTIGRLTDEYEVHPNSGFQTLRHRTRGNYRSNMRRLKKDAGHLKLGQMTAADFQNLHDSWLSRGKTIPHSLITQLRLEVSFGVDVLKDRDCQRAALVLHKMQFASPEYEKGRPLTPKEARSFLKHARAEGRASLALGQAFQMDCGLKQKDVVGEWTPLSEQQIRPTATIDHKRKQKWHWGLCWEEIDEALVLRHVTSMTKELVEKDLKTAQMVKEELEAKYGAPLGRAKLPATGPVIIDEDTEFPYLAQKYREIGASSRAHAAFPQCAEYAQPQGASRPRSGTMSAAAHRVKEPSMFARAPKNETPASRRALHVSPSKGCTSNNRRLPRPGL